LNGVMALILRYFTEFGRFRGTLRKSGWKCRLKKFMFAVSSHFFGRPISLHPVQPAYFDSVHRLALSNSRDATIMV